MKKFVFGILALCMLMLPDVSHAENCNPRGGVCVGTPTGKPCGQPGELCCSSQGYDYDCVSSNYTCNPATDECVPLVVECIATCYTIVQYYYEPFDIWGNETWTQIENLALLYCDNIPAQYVTVSCAY